MIKYKDTIVSMNFDSGLFKNITVSHPKLKYPNAYNNGISKDKINEIEFTIAVAIKSILEVKKDVD